MKKVIAGLAFGLLLGPVCVFGADSAALETQKERISYSMGLDLGNYLSGLEGKIDLDILKQGIDDGFSGAEPRLTAEQIEEAQEEFASVMKAEQEEMLAEMKEKNAAIGTAFLEEHRKAEHVTVTESGLQYEVLREADGQKPAPTDTVKVDYVGTLVDGSEFDSSIKRGEPAVFQVDQVIPGWSEALQLMNVGSKYRVVIPSGLAYGERGAAPVIEPNSVLIFEIDLLSIEGE